MFAYEYGDMLASMPEGCMHQAGQRQKPTVKCKHSCNRARLGLIKAAVHRRRWRGKVIHLTVWAAAWGSGCRA